MRPLLAVLLLLAAACAPVDVVVATVPDGGRPPHASPCADNDDCAPDSYCDKLSCAEPVGRCLRRPLLCDDSPAPVCGCNGVTYWNDCLRQLGGAESSTSGECSAGASCTVHADCPDALAWCAHLVVAGGMCPAQVPGACWVVPTSCPQVSGWRPCGGGACGDLCAAVRAEVPWVHMPAACP